MDLSADPDKRRKQLEPVLMDTNVGIEKMIKLYDDWTKYYDQVSSVLRQFYYLSGSRNFGRWGVRHHMTIF